MDPVTGDVKQQGYLDLRDEGTLDREWRCGNRQELANFLVLAEMPLGEREEITYLGNDFVGQYGRDFILAGTAIYSPTEDGAYPSDNLTAREGRLLCVCPKKKEDGNWMLKIGATIETDGPVYDVKLMMDKYIAIAAGSKVSRTSISMSLTRLTPGYFPQEVPPRRCVRLLHRPAVERNCDDHGSAKFHLRVHIHRPTPRFRRTQMAFI